MTDRDRVIMEVLRAARTVQEFLWSETTQKHYTQTDWVALFRKRVDKIAEIKMSNGSASIELRKRLLQQAGLSIKAIEILDRDYDYITSLLMGDDDFSRAPLRPPPRTPLRFSRTRGKR